ncbi:MAG: phospholipid carrier-dependent glycosyltransferase [Patescibacteria group bacterium]|nr:phospholipid carrier-dependent glycosyltransferase [Patescibacteria group bacterium]
MKKNKKPKIKSKKNFNKILFFLPEIIIFTFAFLTRFIRLGIPNNYIFDEVYHAFTAEQMLKGNPAAWEWWNTPPKGFAYEWTHPPLAKEFMVIAMSIFGDNPFAWRFFSALFGFGVIVLIYLISYKLFKNRLIALFAAFAASMDGLLLTMSRIAMNDMYFLFFILLALLFFLHNRKFLMGIALGLSLAAKWTGLFGIGIIGIIYVIQLLSQVRKKDVSKKIAMKNLFGAPLFFIILPLAIYLAVYLPFFTGKHTPPGNKSSVLNVETFIGLQQQMYWYHTNLRATHPYQSKPTQWVFDLRPVWIYVDYKDNTIANIYNLGNPLFMWFGLVSIIFLLFEFVRKRALGIAAVLIGYFGFFLPWVDSPRIMFYYHYMPAVPFLAIATGYVLNKLLSQKIGKAFLITFLSLLLILFVYFFPLWTAIHIPRCINPQGCVSWYDSYFWFSSWK